VTGVVLATARLIAYLVCQKRREGSAGFTHRQ
jgi:hypothetical protein